MKNMINYNKHYLDTFDYKSLLTTAKSQNLTQGTKVLKFENNLCKFTKSKYCITTNSASTALYISIKTILIREKVNKYCYISPNTYAATANCAILNGLKVKFVTLIIVLICHHPF